MVTPIISLEVNSLVNYKELMRAINFIKQQFFDSLSNELNLIRVQAPLFIPAGFEPYSGIYTEGHFIRAYEPELTATHSLYVTQLEWEQTILIKDRNIEYLQSTVRKIFTSLKKVEEELVKRYSAQLQCQLPDQIQFIHSEELEERFPKLTPREREISITKEFGAVFIIGIGYPLPKSGQPHGDRNPDQDDWSTQNCDNGYRGLNGDILVWDSTLDTALELSSMGIRVCPKSLELQSIIRGSWEYTKQLDYHKSIVDEKIVYSIGGGIGIDRVLMWMLRKRHIGEIQVGIWPQEELKAHPEYLQ
ncbi:aspartate--ammonia ligase [Stylonychia lemnae]|uniref:Aspartate--ammonia ligase n=1 Tax=Stylonychia lemnae TaxID=5949 RepID=A0A078ASS7_STYLE|nr:aspartate--ammonia ligase [Stylonychia lemnae]|eukprot:CDW83878.1 aspartate--ammonia ligase [Stylonychia lemnae]